MLTVSGPVNIGWSIYCHEFEKFLIEGDLLGRNLLIADNINFPNIDWMNHAITVDSKCSLEFLKFCLTSSLGQLLSKPIRYRNSQRFVDLASFEKKTSRTFCKIFEVS